MARRLPAAVLCGFVLVLPHTLQSSNGGRPSPWGGEAARTRGDRDPTPSTNKVNAGRQSGHSSESGRRHVQPWTSALFEGGDVHVLRLSLDPDELQEINAVAKHKCDNLQRSKQVNVPGMEGPALTGISAADPPFVACSGLNNDKHCWLDLDVLGPNRVPGICTTGFHSNFPDDLQAVPMCVPVEVYGATHACQGKSARVGDKCTVGDERVSFHGVCGNDQQGTGMLGCYTDTGARFLRYLTRGMGSASAPFIHGELRIGAHGQPEANRRAGKVAVRASTGSSADADLVWSTPVAIKLRRHGGWAMCRAIEVASIKLPFYLADSSSADEDDSVGVFASEGVIFSTGMASDPTLARAHIAGNVMRQMGVWVPRTSHVRVYINGDYHGLFVASEKLSAYSLTKQLMPSSRMDPQASTFMARAWHPSNRNFTVARVANQGWAPQKGTNEDGRQLAVAGGEVVYVLSAPPGEWWLVENTAHTKGWAPAQILQQYSCGAFQGTLYEPESKLDTRSYLPSSFVPVDGNKPQPLWSDLDRLYTTLHAAPSNKKMHGAANKKARAAWRKRLEAVFDVRQFLVWLAANALVGNGDTYGKMSHNYLLFAPPCAAPMRFLPYDFDNSWPSAGSTTQALPVDMTTDHYQKHWPLVGAILADTEYRGEYIKRLKVAAATHSPALVAQQIKQLQKQLTPFLDPAELGGEDSELTKIDWDRVEEGFAELLVNVRDRQATVQNELSQLERAEEERAQRAKHLDRKHNQSQKVGGKANKTKRKKKANKVKVNKAKKPKEKATGAAERVEL